MGNADRAELLSAEFSRITEILSREPSVERVILFGSAAEGSIGEWSDLDIVVVMNSEIEFRERVLQLHRLLSPRVGVDLLVYTPAEWEMLKGSRPFVRDEIVAKGRTVYERARTAMV